MNMFLTQNPTVVILLDETGKVKTVANNISSEINVTVTDNPEYFDVLRRGIPFKKENDYPYEMD